jgi:hypothetical protein
MHNIQKPMAPTSKQTSETVTAGNFAKFDLDDQGKRKDNDHTKDGVKRCC